MKYHYFWKELFFWFDDNNIQIIIIDLNSIEIVYNDIHLILELKNKFYDEVIKIFNCQNKTYIETKFNRTEESLELLKTTIKVLFNFHEK